MSGTLIENKSESVLLDNDVFAELQGKEYGIWIESRGGHSFGDLIENPSGGIEDYIRTEIHAERDLEVTAKASATDVSIDRPLHKEVDYYNGSYFHNVTLNQIIPITDFNYDQSGNEWHFIATGSPDFTATQISELGFLTNINCNIDTTLFDAFESARSDWIFTRSYNKKEKAARTLKQLCFEFHAILFESVNTSGNPIWKIIPLDTGSSIQTLGIPVCSDGNVQFNAWLTNPQNIFTEYLFNYAFDYGKGDYIGQIFCNKKDSTSGLGSTYEGLCQDAETNYRVQNKFNRNLDNIYDSTTAKNLMKKIISQLTFQKLVVWGTWELNEAGELEYGDLVKVNYSNGMPSSMNNSTIMMIKHKKFIPDKKNPLIQLTMMELPT